MIQFNCEHCNCAMYPDDETTTIGSLDYHVECAEELELECDDEVF